MHIKTPGANAKGGDFMNRNISAFSLLALLAGLVLMHCSSPSEPDSADYSALPRQMTPEEIELAASASLGGCVLNHLFSLKKAKEYSIFSLIRNRRSTYH